MPTYNVSSSAALMQALKGAKSGDTIALAAGTYDAITIKNFDSAGITITSADAKHPAVLTGLTIRNSSGITVSNLEMLSNKASGSAPFMTYDSSNVHFTGLKVHGTPGLGSDTTVDAMVIKNSTNVSVTNSEFYDLWHGLGVSNNTGVAISGNSFHDLRTDGVRGTGNSKMVISENMFTNFNPAEGDHADAIQLWTSNSDASARDITISDNLIVRGTGAAIQGIFIRDEKGDRPFYNVNVTGNMVLGGNANGISLDSVVGGKVSGNTVIGTDDHRSWIRVNESTGVSVAANTSTFYMTDASTRDGRLDGNALALGYSDGGDLQVDTWLRAHTKFDGVWGNSAAVMKTLGLSTANAMRAATLAAAAPTFVTVQGTAGDDKLKVKVGFDSHLYGGAGDDSLTGAETGNNKLIGGAGDDTYAVKGAGDVVVEDANGGYDTVSTMIDYTLGANVEMLRLAVAGLTGTGNELDNRIVGTNGTDRMYGLSGDDMLQGLDGNDFLYGGNGDDDLRADGGNDVVYGGSGNDTILGGDGNDQLFGDAGDDVIEGGAGTDIMSGGAGADIFKFRAGDIAGDTITDFTSKVDRIDLRAIDANALTAKDDAFKMIGTQGFHKVAGELRYDVVGGHAIVSGDVNGDGKADFSFTLQNVSSLLAADFLL